MKSLNLNHIALRAVLMVLLVTCGVGEMWADPTYYYAKLTVQCKTGDGYVYASKENTSDVQYGTGNSTDKIQTTTQNEAQTFFAWAMPGRGAEFAGWEKTSNINSLSGSSNPYTVTVKASSTDVTEGKLTATWTKYTKVNVTYNASEDGEYKVNYSYNSYDGITKTITAGDAEGLSCTINSENGNKTIGSYYNDVITLTSEKGTFQGWYSDAGFTNKLSDANPYTYVAPQSGTGSVYAKYPHVDKYYGRLKASIAEEPYSMPGGGMIFISKESAAAVEYSDEEQTVDNVGMGTTDLIYYLKAQPTDKRYVFRGWYSNPECTGTALSTNKEYTYTFTASSTNSASPTLGNIYAAFDFNLYYMQVEVEPAVPGLGMVLVKDNNTGTPDYTEYATNAEQFLFAYRLAPTANAYLYAKPKYGYKFSGWYDNPDCTGTAKSTANPYTYAATGTSTDPMNPTIIKLYAKFVEDASTVNITYNKPDQTKGEYTASVLDIAEVDDDFVWTFKEVFTSVGKSANTTQAQHKTDVLRLEAQPKAGYGVTSWTIAGTAKTTPSQLYETTGTAAATYGVTFGDAKPFLVSTNSTQYATLREALTAVGNSGKITVVQNAYVEAGNYTIPSGVTLLVPYESTGKSYTSPSTSYEKAQNFASATQYVLLTIGSGANIYLAGSIIVMADLCAPNGGGFGSGAPLSAYGRIAMSENSTITVNSGANLYCWGYITGIEGLVTAKSGAKIHEIFQHQNNPGGTAASGWNEDAFFLNQYYVQNIESPLKIEYGASETVYAQMTVPSGSINNLSATLIDKDNTGMFALTSSGSYLIRTYSPSTDRITYDIYGNAKLNYISMSVYGMDLNTSKYVLPITSNMSVKCHPINGASSTFIVQYAVSFIPGAELIVDEGVTLNAQNKLIIYDREEWIDKGFAQFNLHSGGSNWSRSSFTPTRTYTRVKADLVDAKVDLNGTMNVSGSLYTTNTGADIISSNGTGVVKLLAAAPNNSNDIQYSSNKLGTSIKVPMTPAQLRNGDDSYTLTAGAVANDQFIYSKSQEKWLKNPKVVSWNANGGTTEASTMAYSEGAFVGELPAAYKDGYTLEGWYTAADGGTKIDATTKVTANITYYAHWTPKSYSITYRDQGGVAFSGTHIDTPTPHPTTHTFGIATPLNGVENKTGYTYGGWYRTPSCSGTVVTTIPASTCKNITLYAKWTLNVHNLTWDANGGTLSGDYTSGEVAYGTTIVVPSVDRENYVFTGWSATPASTMPDNDLTYTAQWAPAVASVTANNVTTNYATIQEAFTAANGKTGATVKLLQDITITSEIALTAAMTIDLNGKTISSSETAAKKGVFKINASGKTVTITDSGTDGKIDHTANCAGYLYGISIIAGSLNIEGGHIYAENTYATSGTAYRAYGINTENNATSITMSGGTIEAKRQGTTLAYGIYTNNTCSLTMESGTITASGSTTIRGIYVKGTTELTNATISSTASGANSYAIFVGAATGNLTIKSGTYTATANGGDEGYTIHESAGSVTINGGRFSGSAKEINKAGGTTSLKGGYYVHNSDLADNCATNYHVLPLTGEDPYKYEVAEAYTITFMNGEDELQSDFVKKDETPSYSGTPEKTASAQYTYTFDGWSTTDGGDKLASLPAVSADATYYAHYATTLQSYDVTFNLQGHGDAITSQTKDYGSKVDKPTDPTADGWIFGGWFKEAACTNEWDFSDDEVQGATELFAKWTMDGDGPKLDIVGWTSDSLTLNLNGIPAAGWPYTINDTEYNKEQRAADRTLTIPYSGSADDKLTITVKDKDNIIYSLHTYTIPHVYGSTANLEAMNSASSIIVVNNGTLTVKGYVAVNAIYVGPEAELVVNSGVKLTVNSLMLRTTPWKAASLDNKGTIEVNDQAYYTRIIADNSKYFQFAIPLASDVKNVRLSNNSKCTYNTSWMLKSYDEESRAINGAVNSETLSNWDLLTPDGEGHAPILGSVGYEMFSNTPYYREYYFPVEIPGETADKVAVSCTKPEGKTTEWYTAHSGWNALCSPFTGKYVQTPSDPSELLKVSELTEGGYYWQHAPEIIYPAVPFYYQVPENVNFLDFSGNYLKPRTVSREWNSYIPTQWLRLTINNQNGTMLDETSIYAHPEKFAPEYETGYDVAKQSLTGGKALIYSELPCGKLAFAAVPDSLAENRIPITVNANEEGEFLFSLMENNYLGRLQHVLLHDTQNGFVTDLLERDYSAILNAGTNAGRFYIQCVFAAEAPAVTTGVNSVESNDDAPQKIMYKNKVYIIYQGRVYDMTGRQCELK